MIILDANGLIYCLNHSKPFPGLEFIVSDELRDEFETALVVNGGRKIKLRDISELPNYSEAYYLNEYAHYLNTFSGVDLSCMRGVTDVTILAMVSSILNQFGSDQQTQLDLGDANETTVTVITNDGDLKKRLTRDHEKLVRIIDPLTL